ncbi:MAG: DNA polymerase III subunit delta' [Betaproteobacteria bacterium]|nr:DNA polymerase III subunit delta' [Betaproteobacteria bacterium]
MLIHGPRGLGKFEMARVFAQRILCEQPDAGPHPCGGCDGCRWFLAENHPDYRQVEPEALTGVIDAEDEAERAAGGPKKKPSNEIKIDQVRDLADFLNIGSHRARRRVALFHPAEAMNLNAANALLKNLEEPAPGACFILVSHRPRRLLPTIRSRCVAFPVRAPDHEAGIQWLKEQGVDSPAEWLALAAGAPLAARDLATSEAGKRIAGWRELLTAGGPDLAERFSVPEREHLEPLVELLQKWAFDQSARNLAAGGRYGLQASNSAEGSISEARRWLTFGRRLALARAEVRHPINPKLFLIELMAEMPKGLVTK